MPEKFAGIVEYSILVDYFFNYMFKKHSSKKIIIIKDKCIHNKFFQSMVKKMIRYLKESSQNGELQFIDEGINPVYKKMLGVVVSHYDRKISYKYNESDETALISVELKPSEIDKEEIKEKEAKKFIDWYKVAINEVVIDDYKKELRKKM
jgi:ribosomal protein S20